MSYLNQSNNGISYCEVIEIYDQTEDKTTNYAIYMGDDTSIVTCEKTSSNVGVYSTDDLENQIDDPNIVEVVQSWYDRKVNAGNHYVTLRQQITDLLELSEGGNYKPIMGLPKLTKMLTSALANVKELMTIYEDINCFNYVCFGYRHPLAEFMDSKNYDAIYLFPDRFYAAACFETRFNNNIYLCKISHQDIYFSNDVLSIRNEDGDKISFLVPVDWGSHSKSLAETFTD